MLFIYTDNKDDAARVAAGGVPYRLDLMLRYVSATVGDLVKGAGAVTAGRGGEEIARRRVLRLVDLVRGGGWESLVHV